MVDAPAPLTSSLASAEHRPGRWAALHVPEFRVLWTSTMFLAFAVHAQLIAYGWLAIELTGTNAGVGGLFLLFGGPSILVSVLGGVIADRYPKRTVLLGTNLLIFGSGAFVAAGVELGFLEYWMLLVGAVMLGSGLSVMGPTRLAFTGDLVERPLLPNAAVLQQITLNGAKVVGPAAAGAFIGIDEIGTGGVCIFTSLLVVVGSGVTCLLPAGRPRHTGVTRSPRAELVDGFRYLRSKHAVLLLIVVATLVIVACQPYQAMLPALSTDIYHAGSSGFGLMTAFGAVGAVAATFWIAGLVHRASVWRLQTLCGIAWALGVMLLGVASVFAVALVVLMFLGGAAAGYQATNGALVLVESDLEHQGRVQSLLFAAYGLSSVIALPLGITADAIGLQATLLGMGSLGIAATIWYTFARRRQVARETTPF